MREAMDVMTTKMLSRKQSVPTGDCRSWYIYRTPGRRTTDAGLCTFDSKSSTPALLEPVDLVTDCSRPVSSMSSSIAVDEITSLPGSPFYRQVLQRRSSSIDSSIMSRPGSDLLDVPIFLVQPRDRSPSMVSDPETPSVAESPVASPVCVVTTVEERDLQHQVRAHRRTRRAPPPKKNNREKVFFGQLLCKIRAFFGQNRVKFGNFVDFPDKYCNNKCNNSGIWIIFRAKIM